MCSIPTSLTAVALQTVQQVETATLEDSSLPQFTRTETQHTTTATPEANVASALPSHERTFSAETHSVTTPSTSPMTIQPSQFPFPRHTAGSGSAARSELSSGAIAGVTMAILLVVGSPIACAIIGCLIYRRRGWSPVNKPTGEHWDTVTPH